MPVPVMHRTNAQFVVPRPTGTRVMPHTRVTNVVGAVNELVPQFRVAAARHVTRYPSVGSGVAGGVVPRGAVMRCGMPVRSWVPRGAVMRCGMPVRSWVPRGAVMRTVRPGVAAGMVAARVMPRPM